MMGNIEETIKEAHLPINSIAMLERMIVILKNNQCNNPKGLKNGVERQKYESCLWLLNQQVHGDFAIINMADEWEKLLGVPFYPEDVPSKTNP